MKFITTLAAPLLVAAVVLSPLAVAAETLRQITVTGEGQVAVEPDMATVRLGVSQRAGQPVAAMNAVSASVEAVLARLTQMGIEARDMQTSNLSLYEVETRDRDGNRVVEGYEASNMLSVRMRDLDQVGAVLGAVLQGGANRLNGLEFGLSDPSAARDAARQAAVADALAKAKLYAEAAGVELGEVISLSENSSGAVAEQGLGRMAMMASDVPVARGELTLSQQITLVIALR